MSVEKKAKDAAAVKSKKVKLVRDSFCMPKEEYAEIEALKQRALALGKAVKKSELLRAGVLALVRANDTSLLAYVDAVPNLKTGRPSSKPEAEVAPPVPAAPQAAAPAKQGKPAVKKVAVAAEQSASAPVSRRRPARKAPAAKTAAPAA